MFAALLNWNYESSNIPDWMHNLARVFIWLLSMLVGPVGDGWTAANWTSDAAHRVESMALGIFGSVWPTRPQFLPAVFTLALAALNPVDVGRQPGAWLKRWLRICGRSYEPGARVAVLRAAVQELVDQAKAGTPITVSVGNGHLPWRLTPQLLSTLDKRVLAIVYPR